ncbi:hypothetical protein B6A10_16300 [Flavobacterium sp. L1I52]|uniref:Lipoprotein n=1 Tax=Flavobacterium pokkalii TaxID=1940408 RepID=A0ABR7UVA5_9FLAO|nr:hypothetical protein [Flavobacterium pokkalii]MBD0726730.1 hypothetical protein [Flavobacterium pokkalii]
MDGIYKFIIILIFFCSCKNNKETHSIEHKFIKYNINVLIDSVESFDMSKYMTKKDIFTIGLIDSITVEDRHNNVNKSKNFIPLKIHSNDILEFKSKYELKLVPRKNHDSNILFVQFCDLQISENKASIIVRKTRGIGMIEDIYFFVKEKNIWVLKKKKMLTMG